MTITIGIDQLETLICQQIRNSFLLNSQEQQVLISVLPSTLQRCLICFAASRNKYYSDDQGHTQFNPYHSGQYSIFLYFLSNELWRAGHASLADRVYYLNKQLNSLDLYYQTDLPDIFSLDHPVGSVLGRAQYGRYFTFQQNCTIGGNHGIYPVLGEHVRLFANATVIGNSTLGNNVFVSAGCYIKDTNIPDNTIVFGSSPQLTLKTKQPDYFYQASPFKCHHAEG